MNNILQFFPHAEGYVNNTVVNGTNVYNYVFNYTDHLGNVRLTYGVDPATQLVKIMEENNYYPFGLKHKNYNVTQQMYNRDGGGIVLGPCSGCSTTYRYKYNGKELQDELGLNMTAMDWRQYDGATGRFVTIDPLAELFVDMSPMAFSFNNPVVFSDPSGLCPECEKNVKNPTAGQSYTSTGGATYTYNNGQWTRQDGQLAEVTVTATAKKKSSDGQAGKKEGTTRLFGLIQNANVNSQGDSPLEEYRGRRDNPGYLPGEGKFDRIFRLMNSSHIEQMQDFGSGGHNMFGGYGRALKAFNSAAYAQDVINLNKATEGGGVLLSGTPEAAINSAMYYPTEAQRGASIFRSIISNHMFMDGNKRTAIEAFKLFAQQRGLRTVSNAQMQNVASKVATGQVSDVGEIAKLLVK